MNLITKNLLSNLTIIILSKNREDSLIKVLKFWEQLPLKVIVLDASTQSFTIKNNSSKFTYVKNKAPYLERIALSFELITTKYVALACDDELYLPSSLEQCIEFLEINPDYISCCGEVVGIREVTPKITWTDVYPNLITLNFESSEDRLNYQMKNFLPLSYYSVMRSRDWIKIWTQIVRFKFEPFNLQELQFEAVAAFCGKKKVLPRPMWFRNLINTPVDGVNYGSNRPIYFWNWWNDYAKVDEKNRFISAMDTIIASCIAPIDIDFHLKRNIIEDSFQSYVDIRMKKNNPKAIINIYKTFKIIFFYKILKNILKILRSILPNQFQSILYKFIFSKKKQNKLQFKYDKILENDKWVSKIVSCF